MRDNFSAEQKAAKADAKLEQFSTARVPVKHNAPKPDVNFSPTPQIRVNFLEERRAPKVDVADENNSLLSMISSFKQGIRVS